MRFNLLITTYRYREEDAVKEMESILNEIGNRDYFFEIQEISGIILGYTNLKPDEIIRKFRSLLSNEPWQFRFVLRVIPIERAFQTDIETITREATLLANEKIDQYDTYRITVEKRHTSLQSNHIISLIADKLSFKVSLKKPKWIVLIQIVGNITGIAVLRDNDIFNSFMEKRNAGLEIE